MTYRAGSSPAVVAFASPVSQPPSWRHSWRIAGPPARWMAPSTPPPPSSDEFAAFTIASTFCFVMSPWTRSIRADNVTGTRLSRPTTACGSGTPGPVVSGLAFCPGRNAVEGGEMSRLGRRKPVSLRALRFEQPVDREQLRRRVLAFAGLWFLLAGMLAALGFAIVLLASLFGCALAGGFWLMRRYRMGQRLRAL